MDPSKPTPTNNLQPTALPTGPYSSRPPSPPYIHVPPPVNSNFANHLLNLNNPNRNNGDASAVMTIHPSPAATHTTGLSPAQLETVTGSRPQSAFDGASTWVYESRRRAQAVLDYLWLGPSSVVRDRAFLLREGVTMVLCARDARFATAAAAAGGGGMLVMGVKRAVEGMGIEVGGVDVADGRELVGAFSVAARVVNEHVLGVASRAEEGGGGGGEEEEKRRRSRGKVLVVCETGNDRSAAVVAAYLMTMYGLDTVRAVQFMQLQRFCVALGDDFKFQLQTYGDILRARGDVGVMGPQQQRGEVGSGMAGGNVKRRIEQTMGEAGENGQDDMEVEMDGERYAGRSFAPFVERDY
ncbi:protein-tyrosine phosphatase-like protein [Chaetomidium leptoderma]|uniref:Protein-tyrosine phosphatase-like protein n=1 Tax=Chaetomidium leptoderma TaxID=669021 RepID=A0AAN6VPK2_9PEZI|nr:protein-tyrosine phosphatase-like protein [Chaetomidium leptoderma]